MALYAFDGTGQKDYDESNHDSNVVKFRDAYQGNKDAYYPGPGSKFWQFLGKIAGYGSKRKAEDAYRKFCENYAKNDRDVDIIGFSRGAAIAVHFANMVSKDGVRDPLSGKKAYPDIRFLGIWDTVAAFGLAVSLNKGPFKSWKWLDFQRINIGWMLTVPKNVVHCFHALALDERRDTFQPTRNSSAYEVWFRGYHSDVGGSNFNVKRSNIALRWMLKKAAACKLPVSLSVLSALEDPAQADPRAELEAPKLDPVRDKPRIVPADDWMHYTVYECPAGCDAKIPPMPAEEDKAKEAEAPVRKEFQSKQAP